MGAVLLQILLLALGAIAPTMIGLVILFLSEDRCTGRAQRLCGGHDSTGQLSLRRCPGSTGQ